MPELDWSQAPIHQEIKSDWKSPEILIEGSLACGKTTVGLDKEIDALLKYPGIPILLFRWTEDATTTKLKAAFDELLSIRGIVSEWDQKQKVYRFPNDSLAYMFGLKAVSQIEIFNKIRGLGVCRILGDQVEEMDRSVAGELRGRLRPNLTATLSGRRFPFQLTFIANPSDNDFWLSKEFPPDNRIKGRKLYSLSIFDNPYLPPETREGLVRTFPEDHPKWRTMVMGLRGMNVTGDAIYDGIYKKELHHAKQLTLDPALPILESFELGTHNPTWAFGQDIYGGGLKMIGGIRGEGLMLADFLPVVAERRNLWFPEHAEIKSCMAEEPQPVTARALRRVLGVLPRWVENGNAANVRHDAIESIADYLRRRTPKGEESFAINTDETTWLVADKDGLRQSAFLHHAFEGGVVWDDHRVSVSNKEIRQVREDGKFANAMRCVQNIDRNFCAGPLSPDAAEDALRLARLLAPSKPSGPRMPFGQGYLR